MIILLYLSQTKLIIVNTFINVNDTIFEKVNTAQAKVNPNWAVQKNVLSTAFTYLLGIE